MIRKTAPLLFSFLLVAVLGSSLVTPQLLPVHAIDLELTDVEDDTESSKETERELKQEDQITFIPTDRVKNSAALGSSSSPGLYLYWTSHILDISTPPPEHIADFRA